MMIMSKILMMMMMMNAMIMSMAMKVRMPILVVVVMMIQDGYAWFSFQMMVYAGKSSEDMASGFIVNTCQLLQKPLSLVIYHIHNLNVLRDPEPKVSFLIFVFLLVVIFGYLIITLLLFGSYHLGTRSKINLFHTIFI